MSLETEKSISFWLKYTFLGLLLAITYLLLWSDSEASIEMRKWLADRLVHSVQPAPEITPVSKPNVSSYADQIARSAPAVVSIQTVGQGTLQKNPNPTSVEDQFLVSVGLNVGSGVIVDSNGHVVTNYHVIKDAKSIKVQLSDGREKIASVIGTDPFTDLALLHIDLDNLPTPFVNLEREVRTGDVVFAIGNPYGRFDQTVTMGIISASRSNSLDVPFYQIDAAIHPGNSGGALINAYGEIVGITSQQLASGAQSAAQTGIGFSIPYPVVQGTVEDLMDDGKVTRGWVGFTGNWLSQQSHQDFAPDNIPFGVGFLVTEVADKGPADTAGMKRGDYVTHINDQLIESFPQAAKLLSKSSPGSQISLSVIRQNEKVEMLLVVGETPAES